ncbi:MAG: hypothetical protein BACC_04489 [Bacteroides sp.]
MARYKIGNQVIDSTDTGLAEALARIHGSKERPLCLCKQPGVAMYVAKVGNLFIIKRMPNSGTAHSPNCDSFQPPEELSGLGQVAGTAIEEDPDAGVTKLKLDFSLSKTPGKKAPAPSSSESDSVKTDGTKLTLRSTLHYLWDQAQFSRYTPAMTGKRTWGVIRRHLLLAAADKAAKGQGLGQILFIPETFILEKKDEITQRRTSRFMKIAAQEKGARQLMIVIGEVKEITTSRYGFKVVFKHLPDCHFMMNEDLHKRLHKRFESELDLWGGLEDSHLILIATFGVSKSGIPTIEEAALMNVCGGSWIPFENVTEHNFVKQLCEDNRAFNKGLRYNMPSSKPMASVVLTDTGTDPVALYLVPAGAGDSYREELDELTSNSDLQSWIWDTAESMPILPGATP